MKKKPEASATDLYTRKPGEKIVFAATLPQNNALIITRFRKALFAALGTPSALVLPPIMPLAFFDIPNRKDSENLLYKTVNKLNSRQQQFPKPEQIKKGKETQNGGRTCFTIKNIQELPTYHQYGLNLIYRESIFFLTINPLLAPEIYQPAVETVCEQGFPLSRNHIIPLYKGLYLLHASKDNHLQDAPKEKQQPSVPLQHPHNRRADQINRVYHELNMGELKWQKYRFILLKITMGTKPWWNDVMWETIWGK